MGESVQIVPVDSRRHRALSAAGWVEIAESWAAELRVSGTALADAHRAVETLAADIRLCELDAGWAMAVRELDRQTVADYPVTPQNRPEQRELSDVFALWERGARVFGAVRGADLLAVTVIDVSADTAETDFTAVRAAERGAGLATAVKACSVLALAAEGAQTFRTGGASANGAALAMNKRLGYVVDERWVSLRPGPASTRRLLLGGFVGALVALVVLSAGAVGVSVAMGGSAALVVANLKVVFIGGSVILLAGIGLVAVPVLAFSSRFGWTKQLTIGALIGFTAVFSVLTAVAIALATDTNLNFTLVVAAWGGIPALVLCTAGAFSAQRLARSPHLGRAVIAWVALLVLISAAPIPVDAPVSEPHIQE